MGTMRLAARVATAGAVVVVFTQLTSTAGQEGSVRVERTQGGYRVVYQDADFNNEWKELTVHDAGRVSASIVSRIQQESPGRWRYEYSVANLADSGQPLVRWSMQVGSGTEIAGSYRLASYLEFVINTCMVCRQRIRN